MDEKKIEGQKAEEVKENDGVLRPNVSYETLLKSQSVPNQQMNARIEQYNHNQGFKPQEPVQPSTKEKPMIQIPNEKLIIEPPKKKSNTVLIVVLLLILVVLSIGTYYYYTQVYLHAKAPSSNTSLEEVPTEENPIIEEVRDKVTSCYLERSEPTYGYIVETTYRYYTEDDKLKRYEEESIMHYLEDDNNESSVCKSVSSRYLGYDGYSYLCNQMDTKNYRYTKSIDLTMLKDKELTFAGQFPTTVKIEQTLDEPIYSYIKKHEEVGFTCEEQNAEEILDHEASAS